MANTTTYTQVGIREDLSDSIWDVSPEEVPFSSNCAKVSVEHTKFEWQTDSLASVSATTAVEGADAAFDFAPATSLLDNYAQIQQKTAVISGTVESVNRAGRAKEMAYQVIKRGKELKRDLEHTLVGIHNAKAAGDASTPRETGCVASYVASNISFGGGGAAPAGTGANLPTVGTARAFTETLLGTVIDACWNSGGNPDVIMLGSSQKRKLTAFTGNAAANEHDNSDKTVINAVSVYESDYGTIKVVPNRFMKATDVLVYEKSYWKIATLRGMQNTEIARTGDAEKRQVLMECGLVASNEASSGIILSLN